MSGRQVLDALCAAGLDPAGLKALLITHEHSDHVKGVGVLSRRLGLPVYATDGTWQGMDSWTFFDRLLQGVNVVGTPGAGFGPCGEGYFRLTAFNTLERTQEALERIQRGL